MRAFPIYRHGITLLEVLMTIFILSVGLLSVFALFLAGREIDARVALKSQAISYGQEMESEYLTRWTDIRQWQYRDSSGSWHWVGTGGTSPVLPILIDRFGLAADAPTRTNDDSWGFQHFAYITKYPGAFQRLTLSRRQQSSLQPAGALVTDQLLVPSARNAVLTSMNDRDKLDFTSDPKNPDGPPIQEYLLSNGQPLRRQTGGNLSAALFLAEQSLGGGDSLSTGRGVDAWFLVFNKATTSYEPSTRGTDQPMGSVRLEVTNWDSLGSVTLDAGGNGSIIPDDATPLNRCMQPNKWILLTTLKNGRWHVHWTTIQSVTEEERQSAQDTPSGSIYELFINDDFPDTFPRDTGSDRYCFAFGSLAHVSKIMDTVTIHQ